jgi:hypothetical protein
MAPAALFSHRLSWTFFLKNNRKQLSLCSNQVAMQTQIIPGSAQMPVGFPTDKVGFPTDKVGFPANKVGFSAHKVAKPRPTTKTTWQQAIDEGACTLEEFIAELQRQVDEFYDKQGNA